jgi:hypothetical protein
MVTNTQGEEVAFDVPAPGQPTGWIWQLTTDYVANTTWNADPQDPTGTTHNVDGVFKRTDGTYYVSFGTVLPMHRELAPIKYTAEGFIAKINEPWSADGFYFQVTEEYFTSAQWTREPITGYYYTQDGIWKENAEVTYLGQYYILPFPPPAIIQTEEEIQAPENQNPLLDIDPCVAKRLIRARLDQMSC